MFESITITEEMYLKVENQIKGMTIYEGSHRREQANEVGVLGELVAEVWMNSLKILFQDERDQTTHDYRLSSINKTIDVKTKDRTVPPQSDYDCSVPLYNHLHQIPDYYLFISLYRDKAVSEGEIRRFKRAYMLGTATRSAVDEMGVVWKKGDIDKSNGTKFWTDCINLKINQLNTPMQTADAWGEKNGYKVF